MSNADDFTGRVFAIDPGTSKCGIAVVDSDGTPIDVLVIPAEQIAEYCTMWQQKYTPSAVVMGNGTGHKALKAIVSIVFPTYEMVNERSSSEMAKAVYYKYHPPKGCLCLLPISWLCPKVPIDGYAAVVIAHRWLGIATTPEKGQ